MNWLLACCWECWFSHWASLFFLGMARRQVGAEPKGLLGWVGQKISFLDCHKLRHNLCPTAWEQPSARVYMGRRGILLSFNHEKLKPSKLLNKRFLANTSSFHHLKAVKLWNMEKTVL